MVTHMLFVMEFPQIFHGETYQQKRPSEISNFNQIGNAFVHKYSYTSDFFLFLYKRLQRRNKVTSDLPRRDISVMKSNLVRCLILIKLELLFSINTHTLDFPNVYTKDRKAVYGLFLWLCFFRRIYGSWDTPWRIYLALQEYRISNTIVMEIFSSAILFRILRINSM